MLIPVPIETLPAWVQEKMRLPPEQLYPGDRVYGYLYDEPEGTIIYSNEDSSHVVIGWEEGAIRGVFAKTASGAPYCVKYPTDNELPRVTINAALVEQMLGRPVDWQKTGWTDAERGVKKP